MKYESAPRRPSRGFTLVELLVVIAIIGMLAALITGATIAARTAVKRTMIRSQVNELETALQEYKNRVGEFPPDFSNTAAVMRHVRKRWQRYSPGSVSGTQPQGNGYNAFVADIQHTLQNLSYYNGEIWDYSVDPNSGIPNGAHVGAVAFWLGGMPDANGMLGGFSADPSNPFNMNGQREAPPMEISMADDLEMHGGVPCVVTDGAAGPAPMAYFRPTTINGKQQYRYPGSLEVKSYSCPDGLHGMAVPYVRSFDTSLSDPIMRLDEAQWYNPTSFQLISAGLDSQFSELNNPAKFRSPQGGEGMKAPDFDNQANFGESATIEGEIEQ